MLSLGEVSLSGVVDVGRRSVEGGSLLLQSMSLKFLARQQLTRGVFGKASAHLSEELRQGWGSYILK